MNRIAASLVILASVSSVGYAFAQDEKKPDAAQEDAGGSIGKKQLRHGPIDLQQFSRIDDLKAADTNGDGTLSREEIENLVMKRMVERMANRMERRLDVNGDGKVTIAEVEQQRQKEFAALDRNNDGKLDRKELRAARHGKHGGHGKNHRGMNHRQ